MRPTPLFSFSATFREGATSVPIEGGKGGRLFKNVTLIKSGLGNQADRHFYPAHVLKEAVESGQFKKLKAYADHPSRIDETVQPERTIRDMVGLYDDVRFVREGERGGRVVGNLRVFRSHKWLSDLVDDLVASDAADKIGISINGAGDTEAKDLHEAGGEINEVQNFRKLYSADIVTEAGAGGGFHTLQEAARAARQERTPMTKKEVLAKIAEAATAGNAADVTKLTKQLAEATDGADKAKGKIKPGKAASTKEAKPAPAEDVEDDVEESASDDDASDDSDDAPDEDADDAARDTREADTDEEDDPDEDAPDEDAPADVKTSRNGSMRERFAAGTRTREAALSAAKGKKKLNARGAPTVGKGSFVKNSGAPQTRQHGRRYAECGDDVAEVETSTDDSLSLQEQLAEALAANKVLKGKISERNRKDMATKVVKGVKGLNPQMQASLANKLVRECRSLEEMQREVVFYTRLLEGAADRVRDEFSDDDDSGVEGMPSRIREGGYGAVSDPDAFLGEVGLPVRQ